MAWIAETDVKNVLDSSKDFSDTFISALIDYTEQAFKTKAGYDVDSIKKTEKINVVDTKRIVLTHYPVTGISSVMLDYGDVSTTIDSDDYKVYSNGIVEFDYGITGEFNITYTAGESTVPNDIKKATTLQVADWISKKDRLGISSKSIANTNVQYEDLPFLPVFEDVIRTYKNTIPDRSTVTEKIYYYVEATLPSLEKTWNYDDLTDREGVALPATITNAFPSYIHSAEDRDVYVDSYSDTSITVKCSKAGAAEPPFDIMMTIVGE